GGRRLGAGAAARADGGADPGGRTDPAAADDAVRASTRGAGRTLVRGASARRALEPARERRAARTPAAARAAGPQLTRSFAVAVALARPATAVIAMELVPRGAVGLMRNLNVYGRVCAEPSSLSLAWQI